MEEKNLGQFIEEAAAVGIDFGTTNTCICIWDKGQVSAVQNAVGETTTSSVVSFGATGYSVGGKDASNDDIGDVTDCSEIFNLKRLLGVEYKSTGRILRGSPFVIVKDAQHRHKYQVHYKGEKRSFYPEQISALIHVLRKVKSDAENRLGKLIKKLGASRKIFNH
ncbi:heat shock cognate 71 kDa protein-like [Sitodiplosis mosellana]|uniref:heat shock cognate 71 kDa protein-like n=1 Tax=Sitodiplosis mosellana TaxID=263140 RepID=UPI002443A0C8|nr:heat shock cognate 71 kDa protein-like [Sitodiplosis mosellana]